MRKIIPFLPVTIILFGVSLSASLCFAQITTEGKEIGVDYHKQGVQAQKNGDLDTAIMFFQKAVELNPGLAVAYNDLGVLYEAKGWNDKAKKAYGRAIELDPNLTSPYFNLGSIYEKEGDLEKSVHYFKKRVLIGEWNEEWTVRARKELASLGVDDPEIRANFLDQHLTGLDLGDEINASPKGNDLDPKKRKRDARMHHSRGKQLYYMGMLPQAMTELGQAVILDPKNKEIQKTFEEVHRKALMSN